MGATILLIGVVAFSGVAGLLIAIVILLGMTSTRLMDRSVNKSLAQYAKREARRASRAQEGKK